MGRLNILNSKEIKKIKALMEQQYGYFPSGEYAFLLSEKGKLFLVNKTVSQVNLDNLRIDRMGLYFGELKPGYLRLSKEGAQFLVQKGGKKVGPIVELSDRDVKDYFEGLDLEKKSDLEGRAVILKFENNILGCAQHKDGKILNFLPKSYRGTVIV